MIKLLVVDDEEFIQESICDFFKSRGYDTYGVSTGEDALSLVETQRPHLVLLDVMLGPNGLNGFQVLEKIKEMDRTIKVIIITGKVTDHSSIARAETLGANDYLFKPLDYEKLEQEALPKIGAQLFDDFRREADENRRLYEESRQGMMQTIMALAKALDERDPYTFGHSERVARYAVGISETMGLSPDQINLIRTAGLLHDIGKIGITDEVLRKPAGLTVSELNEIKTHPVRGAKILQPIPKLREITEIVLRHHEYYDGSGYSHGQGDVELSDKPTGFVTTAARILAVSDAYDAMTSPRSYRDQRSPEAAYQELIQCEGTQFDPEVVAAFHKYYERNEQNLKPEEFGQDYRNYTILLVGHDIEGLGHIKSRLGKNFTVKLATNIEEASQLLDHEKVHLTIILEEVPSGWQRNLIDKAKNRETFPHTRIAFMSTTPIEGYDRIVNQCQLMKYIFNPSNPLVLQTEIMRSLDEAIAKEKAAGARGESGSNVDSEAAVMIIDDSASTVT